MAHGERIVGRSIAAAALLLAALGLLVPASAGAGAGDASLPADGDPVTIVAGDRWFPRDEQGRAFVLHGYNIKLHGDRLHTVTPDRLRAMRTNGFTVLRLATFWSDLEPTEGDWDLAYVAELRRILRDADQVGLRVVLTMHQDSYSPEVGGYGMPDWTTRTDGLTYTDSLIPCTSPANQRAWEHFWEDEDLQQYHVRAWAKLVDELGDEPAVYGYDLLNEPCGQQRAGETLVESLQRVEAEQITPMLQRVTDAIRQRDRGRWIFLEGAYGLTSSLGAPTGLGPVADPTGRQIFAPHIYDLAMETGADWNPASAFVTDYYSSIVTYGADHEVPTVVFEWGPQKPALPNAADYAEQVMRGADEHLAGWAAFAWAEGLAGWSQLDAEGNPGAGMTDNVQVYPMQVAGRPMAIDADHADGSATVEVDPVGAGASGPTTFFFPLRRFPAGPEVTVDLPPAGPGSPPTPLPAERWRWRFDPATQTVSVDVDPSVPHTITVRPAVATFSSSGSDPIDVDGDGRIAAGDHVVFTFTIENLTDRDLGRPTVDDRLLGRAACPAGALTAGATVTCEGTYVLTEADAAAGAASSEATMTVDDVDGPRTLTASTTVEWVPSPPVTEPTATTAVSTTATSSTPPPSDPAPGTSAPRGGGASPTALARTGTAPGPLLLTGLGLLAVGAATVAAARRRRVVR